MLGVTVEELNEIITIIEPFRSKYCFFAYGSRVKGNFRPLSDLDIMVKGKAPIIIEDLELLKEKFDNSSLSYVVNIVDFFSLSESFYDMIKGDLVKI